MAKKVYKQECFAVITKNSNWEILTKNFNIFGVHRKIQFLGGEGHKKPIERGDCLKRGGWDSLQI